MPILFHCPHCDQETNVTDEYAGKTGPCATCGQTITVPGSHNPFAAMPQQPSIGHDARIRLLLPVGRSALAIAAGYMGLFAVLFFPAPVALILGILAVRDIRKNPHKHGMGRAIFGIVMGAIFSLLLLFVVLGSLFGY
jgi:hypothetical protein